MHSPQVGAEDSTEVAWGLQRPRPTCEAPGMDGRRPGWHELRASSFPGRTVAILEQGQGSGDLPRMHPVLTLNGITLASDLAPCLSVPSLETGVRGALLPRRNEDSMHISDGPRAGKPALPWPCNAADATRPRGAPSKGPCPGYGLPGWEIGAPSRTSDAARVRLLGKGRPGPDVLFSRTRCSSLATGHDPALPVA